MAHVPPPAPVAPTRERSERELDKPLVTRCSYNLDRRHGSEVQLTVRGDRIFQPAETVTADDFNWSRYEVQHGGRLRFDGFITNCNMELPDHFIDGGLPSQSLALAINGPVEYRAATADTPDARRIFGLPDSVNRCTECGRGDVVLLDQICLQCRSSRAERRYAALGIPSQPQGEAVAHASSAFKHCYGCNRLHGNVAFDFCEDCLRTYQPIGYVEPRAALRDRPEYAVTTTGNPGRSIPVTTKPAAIPAPPQTEQPTPQPHKRHKRKLFFDE